MKSCTLCGASFTDRIDFCFYDGTVLAIVANSSVEASDLDVPMPGNLPGDALDAPMPSLSDSEADGRPLVDFTPAPLTPMASGTPGYVSSTTESPMAVPVYEAPGAEPPVRSPLPSAPPPETAPARQPDAQVPPPLPPPPPPARPDQRASASPPASAPAVSTARGRPADDDDDGAPAWLLPAIGAAVLLFIVVGVGLAAVVGLGGLTAVLGSTADPIGSELTASGSDPEVLSGAEPTEAAAPPTPPISPDTDVDAATNDSDQPDDTDGAMDPGQDTDGDDATGADREGGTAEDTEATDTEPPTAPDPDPTGATPAAPPPGGSGTADPPSPWTTSPGTADPPPADPPPAATKVTLTLKASKPGASITVDGQPVSGTSVEVDRGKEVMVEATLADHVPFSKRVRADGTTSEVNIDLQPVAAKRSVLVSLLPAKQDAILFVDGQNQGKKPWPIIVQLSEGRHTFKVVGAGVFVQQTEVVRFEGQAMPKVILQAEE